jgi:RimJ/RimL family protein N-acetyltransferase
VTTRDQAPPTAGPLAEVRTGRLDLRRFAPDDLDELAGVFAEPAVWRYPYGRGFTRIETGNFLDAQIEHWNTFGFGCWAARLIASGAVIGFVGLSVPTFLPEILPAVEVGWRLAPATWGHGYATEGAATALQQAFTTLRLERVCSLPQADNPPSARVAERLGISRNGEVRIPANQRRGDLRALFYEIEREDWSRAHAGVQRGQVAAMPTIGLLRGVPPIEPSKGASPKAKIPPSEATNQ